jgi:hypothetical protein
MSTKAARVRANLAWPGLAVALLIGALTPHPVAAQDATTIAQSGGALFPGAPVYRGVRLSGMTFATGGAVITGGGTFGNSSFKLVGVNVTGGQPREMSYIGTIAAGSVSPTGVVSVSGSGTLDPGDGSPVVTGIPFLMAVTPGADGGGSLALTVEAANLGAAVVDGVIFTTVCQPPDLGSSLRFLNGQTLSWSAAEGATAYNVYRGTFDGGAWSFDHACFAPGVAGTSSNDASIPSPGHGFYYIVAVKNACGEGSLGVSTNGSQVPNAAACP